jgi:transcriptional regulator with XRE-family HTH domain
MPDSLAIYCYFLKQPIASTICDSRAMQKKSINEVLAENLRQFMTDKKLTQKMLEKESGVAQTTISLYLNPENRKASASGKAPSGKLAEVEQLANAMGLEFWELVLPMNAAQRLLFRQFRVLLDQAQGAELTTETENAKPRESRRTGTR